jgi:organic radical activating enzyme
MSGRSYAAFAGYRVKLTAEPCYFQQTCTVLYDMVMRANIEIEAGTKTFASGFGAELVHALRRSRPGDLLAVLGSDASLGVGLEAWCRFTRNSLVDTSTESGRTRWLIRCGEAPAEAEGERPIGSRLWLYTNFDCNLQCDYCCVRSAPTAPRRALGLTRVQRIAREAAGLGVADFFLTGGEPFLLPDIADIALACADVAPVTLLTNGMLFGGRRRTDLRRMPRDRVTLQISIDSPTPALHDAHRGAGSWQRAWDGVQLAREDGFRVRLAATVATADAEDAFRRFLDAHEIPEADRVIRRVARRGFAASGVALARADVVPEITITADGVYWHPVGADDLDMLVTTDIFPLEEAARLVSRAVEREREIGRRLAHVFHCA